MRRRHLQLHQTEWMTVTKGHMTYVLDGVVRNVTAADGPQELPRSSRHTFWCPPPPIPSPPCRRA